MIGGRQTMTRDTRGLKNHSQSVLSYFVSIIIIMLYYYLNFQLIRLSGGVVCGRFVGLVSIGFTEHRFQNEYHRVHDHPDDLHRKLGHPFAHYICIFL